MTKRPLPSLFRVVWAVCKVTFSDIVRDKILYNSALVALLLLGAGFLASRLSFIRPDRIVLDFGMSALNLSSSMIAILIGASILVREIERRTIDLALSHPVTRGQFIIGKFLGLSAVLFVNWLILSAAFVLVLFSSAGADRFAALINSTFFIALAMLYFQSILLASLAILLSTFSTVSLSVMMCIGFYLIGNNISQLRIIADRIKSPVGSGTVNFFAIMLPNLEHFNLGFKVTYGLPVTWTFFGTGILYAVSLCALSLLLSGFLIRGRES